MQNSPEHLIQRLIAGVFGFTFAAIGFSLLVSMWTSSFGGFGDPPLMFRLCASLISLPFMAIGGSLFYSAITNQLAGQGRLRSLVEQHLEEQLSQHKQGDAPASTATPKQTQCPNCSAPIGLAEISPSGDVKCLHCKTWYNVHHPT